MLTTVTIRHLRSCGVTWVLSFLLSGGCSLDTAPSFGRHVLDPHGGGTSLAGQQPSSVPSADAAGSAGPLDAGKVAIDRGAPDAGSAQGHAPVAHASDAGSPQNTANPKPADPAPGPAPSVGASVSHACREGNYAGDFTCMVSIAGVSPVTATAQATFTLQEKSAGTLTVTNSDLAFDLTGYIFAGDLSGSLDCAAGAFHADIVNGMFVAVLLPIPGSFTGAIDGQIDDTTNDLAGAWSFMATAGGPSCSGSWHATLQP
jgi:hypothetical protein